MYGVAILGGGPAGTGALMWAAQSAKLGSLLDHGVAIVERTGALGGTLGSYIINANFMGTSFLECLDPPSSRELFSAVYAKDVTRRLELLRYGYPPLRLIAEFEECLGAALARIVTTHPGGAFLPGTTVSSLHLNADGSATARFAAGGALTARSMVMALGGRQDPSRILPAEIMRGVRLADVAADKIMFSGRLLTQPGLDEARQILGRAGSHRVVVVGGSHSAFSTVWALLHALPGVAFADGDITLLHRDTPRVFYPSEQAAHDDGYAFTEQEVCPMTRRVHRLGGLRNDGREMWRRLSGRPGTMPERRATMIGMSDPALPPERVRRLLDDAALVVPALGYRFNTVPVFDPAGRKLRLMADEGRYAVGRDSRLLLADGTPLPNVFGIGLASGYRPWGDMAGEPAFDGQQNSLWLFQHGLGRQVYEGVRNCLAPAPARPRRLASVAVKAPPPRSANGQDGGAPHPAEADAPETERAAPAVGQAGRLLGLAPVRAEARAIGLLVEELRHSDLLADFRVGPDE